MHPSLLSVLFRMGTEKWIYRQTDLTWNLNLEVNLKKNYLFLAMLGLCGWTWAFSSCREWRPLSRCGEQTYCGGFSGCGARALGTQASGAATYWLQYSCTSSVALWHVGSSRTRDWTRVTHTSSRVSQPLDHLGSQRSQLSQRGV